MAGVDCNTIDPLSIT